VENIFYLFILTKHETDFSAANSYISRGNIRVGVYMPVKFRHKTLTETHNLIVGFIFGIKIRSAFTAAHRQTGERIFENLFKS